MHDSIATVATWVGSLMGPGASSEHPGDALATRLLGEEGLTSLRARIAELAEEELERQRIGAVHACIWMARADDETATGEAELLDQIIAGSALPWGTQQKLIAAISTPLSVTSIAEELTEPSLRELILGLAWEVALADGRVEDEERHAHRELAEAFGLSEERSRAIRELISGAPR